MAEPLLAFENVRAGYGEAIVLDNVSFAVPECGSLAVLGRNGVGKSTLLLTVLGFTRVWRGTILWRGRDITALTPVLPENLNLLPFLTLLALASILSPTLLCCSWGSIAMRSSTMPPVVTALLAFVVSLFQSRQALHLRILALQHQVSVYKRTVPRPRLCPSDRLFWSWLSRLWLGWQDALQFVQPRTVIAWQKKRFRAHWRRLSQPSQPGRPSIAKEVRDLIQDMSQANPTWGSPRIVGELRKLGIHVAKSTVEKYRVRHRKPSSPTWKAFFPTQPRQGLGLHGFFCGADRGMQGALCPGDAGP
jgi:energy-coupling factor transporter ATP-binding protein EcfA2